MKFVVVTILGIILTISSTVSAEIKTVRMGTEGAYSPFNYFTRDGKLAGFDVEIGKALCAAMKVECTWVTSDWDGIIPALQAKKFDVIMASMSITEERKKQINFTKKYYMTPARFMGKKNSGIEINKKSLQGKVVGVQGGTVSEDFVRGEYGDTVKIKTYGSQDEANLDFISGRVDLVFAESVVLLSFLDSDQGEGAEFIGPGFSSQKYFGDGIGIAVRQGEDELLEMLNKAIDTIRADGRYQKINAKYFDFDIYGE